ncbi:hypothetical protein Tco_0857886 [Tanacetum coccineum]|uniref:Uncharacterized protein n=1 Tax=Tanacetum coccineum TaxID=301880 RepID=A0ABQ5BBP8_9ASTR
MLKNQNVIKCHVYYPVNDLKEEVTNVVLYVLTKFKNAAKLMMTRRRLPLAHVSNKPPQEPIGKAEASTSGTWKQQYCKRFPCPSDAFHLQASLVLHPLSTISTWQSNTTIHIDMVLGLGSLLDMPMLCVLTLLSFLIILEPIRSNMLMARLATKSAKPDGQCYLPFEKVDEFMEALSACYSQDSFQKEFGHETSDMLWKHLGGIDNCLVAIIQGTYDDT